MLPRRHEPELMDDPALDPWRHAQALRGLARINWWSRSAEMLWPPIRALVGQRQRRALRALDVATGGGDVPIRLCRMAARNGVSLQCDGCDRSPTAIDQAQRRATRRHTGARFFVHDALEVPLPSGYDVVMCSLFFHHLTAEQTLVVLGRMKAAADRLVLVNDLVRCRAGLVLAYVGTRMLSRSRVVHIDGPRSVRAAWTPDELTTMAERAGLSDATVEGRWLYRMLLQWKRS